MRVMGLGGMGGGGVHFILVEGFEARKGWINLNILHIILDL